MGVSQTHTSSDKAKEIKGRGALTSLDLRQAHLEHLDPPLPVHVLLPMRIQTTQREERAVPMSGVRHARERSEVVDPVECGSRGGDVVAS